MSETAVGLFHNSGVADAVVDALRANGLPSNGVRVLAAPTLLPVDSPTSTPGIDFAAALARDLRSMGASDRDCEAYLAGVKCGNVLVCASGSSAQTDTAVTIMNEYDPLEVEEIVGAAVSAVTGAHLAEDGLHDISSKENRTRAKTAGARVFTW
jgi:hypothetical protein